jgi:hypothetical protein
MDTTAQKYITGCKLCHQIKAPRHTHHCIIMPLPPLTLPGKEDTMDFITDDPESTASGYFGISIVVDQIAKLATYLLCSNNIELPELAQMVFEHVMFTSGVLDITVTCCGLYFINRLCNRVCSQQ